MEFEIAKTTIGLLIATCGGVVTAYMLYMKNRDGADDRLINLLKGTVDELEKKVNQQTENIDVLTRKMDELEHENELLIEVLQGRDKSTLEFQKQMLETMRVTMETNGLAKDTSTKIGELMGLMTSHLKIVEENQKLTK